MDLKAFNKLNADYDAQVMIDELIEDGRGLADLTDVIADSYFDKREVMCCFVECFKGYEFDVVLCKNREDERAFPVVVIYRNDGSVVEESFFFADIINLYDEINNTALYRDVKDSYYNSNKHTSIDFGFVDQFINSFGMVFTFCGLSRDWSKTKKYIKELSDANELEVIKRYDYRLFDDLVIDKFPEQSDKIAVEGLLRHALNEVNGTRDFMRWYLGVIDSEIGSDAIIYQARLRNDTLSLEDLSDLVGSQDKVYVALMKYCSMYDSYGERVLLLLTSIQASVIFDKLNNNGGE